MNEHPPETKRTYCKVCMVHCGLIAEVAGETVRQATREGPAVKGRGSQPELREEQAGPSGVADKFVVLMRPGNAGGGKEPDFWHVTGSDQESGDWRSLSTPSSDSAVTEGTLLTREDCTVLGVTTEATAERRVPVDEASRRARCVMLRAGLCCQTDATAQDDGVAARDFKT